MLLVFVIICVDYVCLVLRLYILSIWTIKIALLVLDIVLQLKEKKKSHNKYLDCLKIEKWMISFSKIERLISHPVCCILN